MLTLPVLISGAGPTGLYLALSLTRNGVPVRIIHKDLQFHNASRGSGIMPRTREIQHFLGVDEALLHWGGITETPTMRLYKLPGGTQVIKTWKIIDNPPTSPTCPFGEPLQVPQMIHERIIREELAKFGVFVEVGKELKTFTQDADGVTAELVVHCVDGTSESTEVVRAAYLCGADGAHGPTRKVIGCTFLGDTETGDAILLADHRLHGLDEDNSGPFWHMWMDREKSGITIGCRPLGDEQRTYSTVVMGGRGFDPEEYLKPGGLAKAFRDVIGRSDLRSEEPISISFFQPNTRMVDKFQQGRVFVLGDAAHVHSPTGGQGLNSSVQDAFNLGWKLALVYKKQAPSSLLATYNEERLPVIAQMLGQTKALYVKTKDKEDDPSVGSMRRGGELLQLGVNYRWSSIVLDTRKPAGTTTVDELKAYAYGGHDDASIVAGDRAPDAPLFDPKDGKATTLFDVFNATKHTVLFFNASGSVPLSAPLLASKLPSKELVQVVFVSRESGLEAEQFTAYRELVDTEKYAYSGYNVPEEEKVTIVIVRPDAYVGAVVHSIKETERYFANVLAI